MRLSGARPNRTWNSVVSRSTAASTRKVVMMAPSKARTSSSSSAASPPTATRKRPSSPRSTSRSTEPQPLVFRPLHVALAAAVGIGRDILFAEMRQPAIPQRARRGHLGLGAVEPRHLPVPARQRQLEQRLAEHLPGLLDRDVRRGEVGDQRLEIDAEAAVERALDRVAVEPGQHEAGDEQDEDGPDRRRKKQPQRKRISAHGACASCHALGGVRR